MAGATQFGVSEEDLSVVLERIRHSPHVEFVGLHVHTGSQILDAGTVLEIFRTCLDCARTVAAQTGKPLQKLNFGGGWGVTYFAGQEPLELEALTREIPKLTADPAYSAATRGTRFIVEPGRYLVAEAGVYATRVLYRKASGGTQFAVVDGGMHNNYLLAGGMGQVLRRNFHLDALKADEAAGSPTPTTLSIAGCLCTPQDILAQNFESPVEIDAGDCVVFFNCGAYGASASPTGFLSHRPPAQILIHS
jgi:diaminopimelate decarboxylase